MPIFLIQIVSSLGFSVLYSTLVLYMEDKLGIPSSTANSVTGIFIAFNYALHVVGGYWGGRFFSNRTLFCIGMLAQFAGGMLLSVNEVSFLYVGLAVFLTGSGINVTCLNCILTQHYEANDHRRETAFLWNYSGMSFGFFIGYTLSGYYQLLQDYHHLFMLSSLGNIVSIIFCLIFWKKLADIHTPYSQLNTSQQRRASLKGGIYLLLLPFCLYLLLQDAMWANELVLVAGLLMFLFCLYTAKQQETKEARNKLIALTSFMLISMIFWMLYQIGPMGLTLFIEHNVDRSLLGHLVAPQWFNNISTLSIVIGGPILAAVLNVLRRRHISVQLGSQFALALLFMGLAFVLLPVGILYANSNGLIQPGWIVIYYILQSIGELLISPIGYAMIGALAPLRLQSLMMGILMLYCGVGATLASYSSNLMIIGQETSIAIATNPGYSHIFSVLGLFAISCAVLLSTFMPVLRKLTQAQQVMKPNTILL